MDFHFRLGIAGRAGHGKTSLRTALCASGVKSSGSRRKGSSGDFDHTPLVLPSGMEVDAADLPSMESSVSWMAAGASCLDAAVFVISCDEEASPNAAEYINVLGLLGVESGIVVLTKADLVGRDALASARRDAEALVKGTFLEGAPIVPVSVVVKKGLPELLKALDGLVGQSRPRDRSGAFFMPIDKVSSVRVGAVVAGVPYSGTVREGDYLEVMPAGRLSRTSSIWARGKRVGSSRAGERLEIGLDLVTSEQIRRGDVLCEKGRFAQTECLEAALGILPSAAEPIAHMQRVRLLVGSFDVVARVSVLSDVARGVEPGRNRVVQLLPESRIAARVGERFVVLSGAPPRAAGGGRILIPCAMRPHSGEERAVHEDVLNNLAANWSDQAMLSAMVRERECIDVEELHHLSQIERTEFYRLLSRLKDDDGPSGVVPLGASEGIILSRSAGARIAQSVASSLGAFHEARPELAGADIDDLRSNVFGDGGSSSPESKVFGDFLEVMLSLGEIARTMAGGGVRYRLPDFEPRCDGAFAELVARLRAVMEDSGCELAETVTLASALGAKPVDVTRALGYLRENDGVEVIGDGLLLPRDVAERALEAITSMRGEISASALMGGLGISRRASAAILAFFDSKGVTRLSGNKRVLRKMRG
ncbi:MAG: SelB C-terminal domain-containing protein [Synergistaceae bacterium]|jgi:selenocysteine-specific elongation factor|nr:SelB C-terminal domain-containing protein [Synergistaceae bacterium]